MVQLTLLDGTAAGVEVAARRFPFRIGRGPECDLQLEADGVWDRHLEIQFQPPTGFVATAQPETHFLLNGEPAASAALRNGDVIGLGAARVRFALSATRLRGLRLRETLTWIALAAICLGQVVLIYRLLD